MTWLQISQFSAALALGAHRPLRRSVGTLLRRKTPSHNFVVHPRSQEDEAVLGEALG